MSICISVIKDTGTDGNAIFKVYPVVAANVIQVMVVGETEWARKVVGEATTFCTFWWKKVGTTFPDSIALHLFKHLCDGLTGCTRKALKKTKPGSWKQFRPVRASHSCSEAAWSDNTKPYSEKQEDTTENPSPKTTDGHLGLLRKKPARTAPDGLSDSGI